MAWISRFLPRRPALPIAFLSAVSANPDDPGRCALLKFIKEDPQLHAAIVNQFPSDSQIPAEDKTAVAAFLTRHAQELVANGNFLRASSTLLFALLVVPDFLEALAGMAITYHAWQDQIAARWAEQFCDLSSPLRPLPAYLAHDAEAPARIRQLREQMEAIRADCKLHPEWRDSSARLQRFGMAH